MDKIESDNTSQIAKFDRMKPKIITAYSYVRFSSKKQEEGHSLERQSEMADKWITFKNDEKKNTDGVSFVLDTKENMLDLGVSGFRGKNLTEGALSTFIEGVRIGKITRGSYLLIENIDRFSRAVPLKVIRYLTDIVEAGISIVTLDDWEEYTEENINDQKFESLSGEIRRAHKESKRKSDLIRKARAKNRQDVLDGKRIFSKKCPCWLEYIKESNSFRERPLMVKAVRYMFENCKDGHGPDRIATALNKMPPDKMGRPEKSIPKPGSTYLRNKDGIWTASTIRRTLRNRAVLGEYQMKSYGQNDGPPKKGYYDPIISENLFLEVQAILGKNTNDYIARGGGQKGYASNLFVHIAKCGICGSSLNILNGGHNKNGRKLQDYLRCKRIELKLSDPPCESRRYNYREVENIVLDHLEDIDWRKLVPDDTYIASRRLELMEEIAANELSSKDKFQEIINLTNIAAITKDERNQLRYDAMITKINDELDTLNEEYKAKLKELESLNTEADDLKENLTKAKQFRKLLAEANPEDVLEMRFRLMMQIRKLVKSIKIWPVTGDKKPIQNSDPGFSKSIHSTTIAMLQIRFYTRMPISLILNNEG